MEHSGIEANSYESGECPEDHDEAFEKHAGDHAESGSHFIFGRARSLHTWGNGNDLDSLNGICDGCSAESSHHGLSSDHVTHSASQDRHQGDKDGVACAQRLAVESFVEIITDSGQPDAAEEKCREPVKRREEQNQKLDPHSADALAVDLARNRNCLVCVSGTADIEKELCCFSQLPSREKKIARVFCLPSSPPSEPEDDSDIQENDPRIQDVKSPYVHQRAFQSLVFTGHTPECQ